MPRPRTGLCFVLGMTLLAVIGSMALYFAEPSGAHVQNIAIQQHRILGHIVHVIVVNLNSPRFKVTPVVPSKGIATVSTFQALVNQALPIAAINGTHFSTNSYVPVGDIVIDGKSLHRGVVVSALAITSKNSVHFLNVPTGSKPDWRAYETVLASGPMLTQNSKVILDPASEGFKDPLLFKPAPRAAVGITRHNKLLMVATPDAIQFRTLAKIMLHLQAVDSMALDGGSSTGLYFLGKTVVKPSRSITNILAVVYR